MFDCCVELANEGVEGALKRGGDGAESGERVCQTWAQETVIGSRKEERDAQADVGDAITEAFGQSLDEAVQAQTAQLISNCTL